MVTFQSIVEETFVWFWSFLLVGVTLQVAQVNWLGSEALASALSVQLHSKTRLWFNEDRQNVGVQGLVAFVTRVSEDVDQWLLEDNVDPGELVG